MSADLRARIAELEAELAEAKADGERGWADAQRREDDGAMWAKTSRRFHEEWKAAEAERDRLRELATEILTHFHQHGYPGEPSVRTCWISVAKVTAWRHAAALDQAPAADSPYATGGEILPRTQGDQIPAQLSGCGYVINPEPAAEQEPADHSGRTRADRATDAAAGAEQDGGGR